MADKTVVGGSNVSASQLKDLFRQIDDGSIRGEHVQALLEHRDAFAVSSASSFSVWKTIKLGTGLKTADDFRKAIRSVGMSIGDWANDILVKPAFTVSETEMEVDLVNVSVGELGFKLKRGFERRDIIAKALSLGLELCPAEVGPQLRLQYPDQKKGEYLVIGMEPISDSDGRLYVFYVEHGNDGRWLNGDFGRADDVWSADDRFVFFRSRK